jgi:hypothetical protein
MSIILDTLTNSLFFVLTLILHACRPNFAEDAFADLFFIHYQDPRH